MKGKKIEIDIEKAKELRAKGLGYAAIGKELGVSKDTIMRRLNEASSPQTTKKELPSAEELENIAKDKVEEALEIVYRTEAIRDKLHIIGPIPDERMREFAREYALAYLLYDD